MFRIELPALVADVDALTSIRWQVANDNSFDSNVIIIDENKREDMFFLDVNLPLEYGNVYYLRTMFIFSDGTDTGWGSTLEITKDSQGLNTASTIIITPEITITANENSVPLGDFNIKLSKYTLFTGIGKHLYTDWRILDTEGNIVWESKHDTYHKETIRVPADTLDIERSYRIEARYVSDTGARSYYGKLYINTITNQDRVVYGNNVGDSDLNQDLELLLLNINNNMYKIINQVIKQDEI